MRGDRRWPPPRLTITLRLRDGRLLGCAECGDPAGKPLLYFHGFPGSRLEAQLGHEAAARDGVRLVGLDRPGFGLSDFKPGHTISEWPDDVVEAADALGIDRFALMGVSSGGPYLAACALRLPQHLTGATMVSSGTPSDAPGAKEALYHANSRLFAVGRRLFWIAQLPMWWLARQARRDPEYILSFLDRSEWVPEPDKAVLSRPEVREAMKQDSAEAFRQGSRSVAWDGVLLNGGPWDFRLQDISMDVQLWHGEEDGNVPPSMARYLASVIPNCQPTFLSGEGHYSLAVNHMEEIQGALFP